MKLNVIRPHSGSAIVVADSTPLTSMRYVKGKQLEAAAHIINNVAVLQLFAIDSTPRILQGQEANGRQLRLVVEEGRTKIDIVSTDKHVSLFVPTDLPEHGATYAEQFTNNTVAAEFLASVTCLLDAYKGADTAVDECSCPACRANKAGMSDENIAALIARIIGGLA